MTVSVRRRSAAQRLLPTCGECLAGGDKSSQKPPTLHAPAVDCILCRAGDRSDVDSLGGPIVPEFSPAHSRGCRFPNRIASIGAVVGAGALPDGWPSRCSRYWRRGASPRLHDLWARAGRPKRSSRRGERRCRKAAFRKPFLSRQSGPRSRPRTGSHPLGGGKGCPRQKGRARCSIGVQSKHPQAG